MTENEALYILNNYNFNMRQNGAFDMITAISVVTNALKEIQQYREIGTVEECREAVEKQKAKAPVVDKYHHTCCPSCGWVVAGDAGWGKEYLPHCENCGQAILWNKDLEGTEE